MENKNDFKWTSQDGRTYALDELNDNHLANIIPYLERRIEKSKRYIAYMKAEQKRRAAYISAFEKELGHWIAAVQHNHKYCCGKKWSYALECSAFAITTSRLYNKGFEP